MHFFLCCTGMDCLGQSASFFACLGCRSRLRQLRILHGKQNTMITFKLSWQRGCSNSDLTMNELWVRNEKRLTLYLLLEEYSCTKRLKMSAAICRRLHCTHAYIVLVTCGAEMPLTYLLHGDQVFGRWFTPAHHPRHQECAHLMLIAHT